MCSGAFVCLCACRSASLFFFVYIEDQFEDGHGALFYL